MKSRAFQPWVEPIAAELRKSRSEIAAFACSAPAGLWTKASPNQGWTNKDLLAHLATGHWVIQSGVCALVTGERFQFDSPDAGNAERVAERRSWLVSALAAEVEAEGEKTQELLAQLTGAHEDSRREGAPSTFGENLRTFPNHEYHHLAQLRAGLEAESHV